MTKVIAETVENRQNMVNDIERVLDNCTKCETRFAKSIRKKILSLMANDITTPEHITLYLMSTVLMVTTAHNDHVVNGS